MLRSRLSFGKKKKKTARLVLLSKVRYISGSTAHSNFIISRVLAMAQFGFQLNFADLSRTTLWTEWSINFFLPAFALQCLLALEFRSGRHALMVSCSTDKRQKAKNLHQLMNIYGSNDVIMSLFLKKKFTITHGAFCSF